jgi:hypothetical protein
LRIRVLWVLAACLCLGVTVVAQTSTLYSPNGPNVIPRGYFGIHGWGFESGHTPWPTAFIGAYRTWDSGAVWTSIEPARGSYDWSKLDSIVSFMHKRGADVLFAFGRVPQWASSNPSADCAGGPGQCAAPASMNDWNDFVLALATRYKGRIKYYELWNEPNATRFWRGSTQQMLQMAKAAYSTIKQVDPDALVLTPAPQGLNAYRWMDDYFAGGGGAYADMVAFHGYPGYDQNNRANPPEAWIKVLLNMKSAMALHGVHKPLWDTEFSWEYNDRLPAAEDKAAYVARMYVLHWLYGVDRGYWDMWDGSTGTLWTGQPTPAGMAYQVMTRWMTGSSLDQCKTTANQTWVCHLVRANGLQSWIVWNANGPADFQPESAWAVQALYDLGGGNRPLAAGEVITARPLPVMLEGAAASNGPDFYLTVSPDSAVMAGGGTAQFKVKLTSVSGFNKSVNMSCQGAPPGGACTASPAQLRLNGNSPATVTFTVSTQPGTAQSLLLRKAEYFAFAFFGLAWVPGRKKLRRRACLAVAAALMAALMMTSCGGGGMARHTANATVAAGSYALTLAATSGGLDHGTYVTVDVRP